MSLWREGVQCVCAVNRGAVWRGHCDVVMSANMRGNQCRLKNSNVTPGMGRRGTHTALSPFSPYRTTRHSSSRLLLKYGLASSKSSLRGRGAHRCYRCLARGPSARLSSVLQRRLFKGVCRRRMTTGLMAPCSMESTHTGARSKGTKPARTCRTPWAIYCIVLPYFQDTASVHYIQID